MTTPYLYDERNGVLSDETGRLFDPWTWTWQDAQAATKNSLSPATAADALARLAQVGALRPLPVGVIGPREATDLQQRAAFAVGAALARLGLTTVCGGKTGVMAAAAAGARQAGGLTIGLLPDSEWHAANPDILVPIATGLREARNVVIARSSTALIAVGGSTGTMTEIAFGLHFGRLVVALHDTATLPGVVRAEDAEAAVELVAQHLLSGSAHSGGH
ncbi:MAG: TIGR00725 family protein [Alphaproteobacteria bacterium]|jgi:uncharacterized protein (TIGR00725 family)|nr:TIGR00725 family protein [Alphaproteobacteria bacterium]